MALQTFNDQESLSTVREKINDGITETELLIVKANDFVAGADAASGNVTAQTSNSISDSTKSFTVNQYSNYGVRLVTSTGEVDYAIVLSNTATQLTFDDVHAGYTFASYRILSTFEITNINSITSVDILANDCAILLPDLSGVENRKFIRVYLEKSNNNGKRAAIICRGAQRQRGFKYGFLNYKYEGVDFWSHLIAPNHWDILALENIKRYSYATVNTDTAVTSATYALALPFANVTQGISRRFEVRDISTFAWFKYMSITQLTMLVNGSVVLERTGGGSSTVSVAVRVKKFVGGTIIDSDPCVMKFSGDDIKPLPITIPVVLDPYDEVTIIAKRDAGTVTIEIGSVILIEEV